MTLASRHTRGADASGTFDGAGGIGGLLARWSGPTHIVPLDRTVPPPKGHRRYTRNQNIGGNSYECRSFLKTVFDDWLPETHPAFTAAHPVTNIPSRMKADWQRETSRSNSGHTEQQRSNAGTEQSQSP